MPGHALKQKRRKDRPRVRTRRLVGAAIVVSAVVAVALATLRPDPFAHPQVIHARFDEAKGLARVERDVRVHGVNVGHIGSVKRVGDDADIEIVLDTDVGGVYRDARAALRPHHAFEGDAFIDLDPGHPSAGAIGEHGIPLSHTTTYVALDQSLRGLDAPRRKAIQAMSSELADTLQGDAPKDVNDTLHELPELAADGAVAVRALRGPTGVELRRAIKDSAATAHAIDLRRPRIEQTVSDARRTLSAVATDNGKPLDATLRELPPTLAELRRDTPSLAASVTRMRGLAHYASPLLRELRPTIAASRPLLRQAGPALRYGPELMNGLRLSLADVARATPALGQVMDSLDSTVTTLKNGALPALRRKSRLGLPTYLQFGAAATGLTGAASNYQTPAQSGFGSGHFLQLDGDVVNGLLGNVTPPVCGLVEGLNPDLAKILQPLGLCKD